MSRPRPASLPDGLAVLAVGAVMLLILAGAREAVAGPAAALAAMRETRDRPDIQELLALQRSVFPGAVVSGLFYDWRAPSRYRAHAGLHLGYDIALPAGTVAVAGWTGQVTRIVRWSGPEHGITVVSSTGYETTYGHLRPRVQVGDVLNAGEAVGTVVIDHVDVKMRGPDGRYYDFGGSAMPSTPPGVAGFDLGTAPSTAPQGKQETLRLYLHALRETLVCADELRQVREAETTAREVLSEDDEGLRRDRELLVKVKSLLATGRASRQEVAEIRERVLSVEQRRRAARELLADARRLGATREARRADLERTMRLLRPRLLGLGVTPADLHAAERKERASVPTARPSRLQAGLASRTGSGAPEITRAQLERYEYLYSRGAISRQELEDVRARCPGSRLTGSHDPSPVRTQD